MFKIVTRGCGGAAAVITLVWLTALSVAASDGAGGVEVAAELTSAAVGAIAGCTVLSVGTLVTRAVVQAENRRMMVTMHDYVTGELREQIETWLGRAQTRAMIQALDVKSNGTGNVASIRRGE